MYIKVRTVDAKTLITLDVSKTTAVSHLKKLLESHFNIKPEKQRLFFRGKQLEDEYTMFDYSINLNDMVQIMEKADNAPVKKKPKQTEPKAGTSSGSSSAEAHDDLSSSSAPQGVALGTSLYFVIGEYVDIRDLTCGAWFEGKITKIFKDENYKENKKTFKNDEEAGFPHDGYFYEVDLLEDGTIVKTLKYRLRELRPRARDKISLDKLKVGDMFLGNYNIEDPSKRGFWYDCIVTKLNSKKKELFVELKVGINTTLHNCKIKFVDELMEIIHSGPLTEREPNTDNEPPPRLTEVPHNCNQCKNNNRRSCKECGCHVCGLKTEENKQIMCDECDYAYHIWCLKPPLEQIPDADEWYCHECKNDENEIVSAGSKLKESKKKSKMVSQKSKSTRDWGSGMACVSRTKSCTIVDSNHFGPIPGIEVGTTWKYRMQVSEAGVHRPHVAGIHGRGDIGAFSIVLSGGYEDDVDNGDEVLYTGSGGRDLSGNKRTSVQSCDQKLDRLNKALAMNCDAPLNPKGAVAKNWRAGKPVRVVRNYHLAEHSKYAPEEGNRYDGIYKVVKYFPKKGKSGFIVWRFLFRRDDAIPAPWTKEGKKRIENLGLAIEYPAGYLDSIKEKEKLKDKPESAKKGRGKKRVLEESPNPQSKEIPKKMKVTYTLEKDVAAAIKKDKENEKLWEECKNEMVYGKPKFLAKVQEVFSCICCTEVVFKPVTTPCLHIFCTACLKRSFQAELMSCPSCRKPLEKTVLKKMNSNLQDALLLLLPGYTTSR